MRTTKSPFTTPEVSTPLSSEHAEQQMALEYLAEAWNMAEEDGISSISLAHASIFAALATLVRAHGDSVAAEIIAALPERIQAGEYNLDRSLQ